MRERSVWCYIRLFPPALRAPLRRLRPAQRPGSESARHRARSYLSLTGLPARGRAASPYRPAATLGAPTPVRRGGRTPAGPEGATEAAPLPGTALRVREAAPRAPALWAALRRPPRVHGRPRRRGALGGARRGGERRRRRWRERPRGGDWGASPAPSGASVPQPLSPRRAFAAALAPRLPLPHVGVARPGSAAAGAAGGPRRTLLLLLLPPGLVAGPAALLLPPPPGLAARRRRRAAAGSGSAARAGAGHAPQEGADGGTEHGAGGPRLHLQPALHRAELPAAGAAPLRVHRHRARWAEPDSERGRALRACRPRGRAEGGRGAASPRRVGEPGRAAGAAASATSPPAERSACSAAHREFPKAVGGHFSEREMRCASALKSSRCSYGAQLGSERWGSVLYSRSSFMNSAALPGSGSCSFSRSCVRRGRSWSAVLYNANSVIRADVFLLCILIQPFFPTWRFHFNKSKTWPSQITLITASGLLGRMLSCNAGCLRCLTAEVTAGTPEPCALI